MVNTWFANLQNPNLCGKYQCSKSCWELSFFNSNTNRKPNRIKLNLVGLIWFDYLFGLVWFGLENTKRIIFVWFQFFIRPDLVAPLVLKFESIFWEWGSEAFGSTGRRIWARLCEFYWAKMKKHLRVLRLGPSRPMTLSRALRKTWGCLLFNWCRLKQETKSKKDKKSLLQDHIRRGREQQSLIQRGKVSPHFPRK